MTATTPAEASAEHAADVDGPGADAADRMAAILGSTNAGSAGPHAMGQGGAGQRAMLTYQLGAETATPLDQVAEILPLGEGLTMFDAGGALPGMLVHRGRSIPLLCLGRLTGAGPATRTAATSVLLVDDDGERLGFVVPRLQGIEPSRWEPAARVAPPTGSAGAPGTEPPVLVGSGSAERMLRVLDLQALARRVQARGTGCRVKRPPR